MGNITLKFLEKDYSIPDDILVYLDLLGFAKEIQQELMNAFLNKVNYFEHVKEFSSKDQDLSNEIYQQTGKFITKLCDNDIYTKTASDYLKDSNGYELYSQANKEALEEIKNLEIEKMKDFESGYRSFMAIKKASVTGMEFSILSNSFIDHVVYEIMQASTINKQENDAEQAFKENIRQLKLQLYSEYSRKRRNYIHNVYIPHMEEAFTLLSAELLNKYLSDLMEAKKFNVKTFDFTDVSRSDDLLENLNLSNNKKEILQNAFAACPYNLQVYINALKFELLDFDSFQTAKYFNYADHILSFLKKNIGKAIYPKDFDLNIYYVSLLGLFTGKNPDDILKERTEQYVNKIVEAYTTAANTISNKNRCMDLLSNEEHCLLLMNKTDKQAILAGDAFSKKTADSYIDSLVPATVWNKLINDYNHPDLLEQIKSVVPDCSAAQSKDDIDAYLKEKLFSSFKNARKELVADYKEEREKRIAVKKKEKEKAQKRAKMETPIIIISVLVIVALVVGFFKVRDYLRIKNYCTFSTEITAYNSEHDYILALLNLWSEYDELKTNIDREWWDNERVENTLLYELDKNYNSIAEGINSESSVDTRFSFDSIMDALQVNGSHIQIIGEDIESAKYKEAFDHYRLEISGKYIDDANLYIVNTLYPETFSLGIQQSFLGIGSYSRPSWEETRDYETLASILNFIDSMPEGRSPYQDNIELVLDRLRK